MWDSSGTPEAYTAWRCGVPLLQSGARQRPEKKTILKEKGIMFCKEQYMTTGKKIISTVFDNRKHYMYCTVCEQDIYMNNRVSFLGSYRRWRSAEAAVRDHILDYHLDINRSGT